MIFRCHAEGRPTSNRSLGRLPTHIESEARARVTDSSTVWSSVAVASVARSATTHPVAPDSITRSRVHRRSNDHRTGSDDQRTVSITTIPVSTTVSVAPMMMTTTPSMIGECRTTSHNQQTQDSDRSQQCATEHDVLSFFTQTLSDFSQPHGEYWKRSARANPENSA